uniref:Cyclic AMP-responsive element-binding protein 3-like protein 4 n=1 Tax=Neogobius melanostomus TaxID=47308 RepID=A0A8C6TA46_9GOBI
MNESQGQLYLSGNPNKMDADCGVLFLSSDPEAEMEGWPSASVCSSDLLVAASEPLQEWAADPNTSVVDSETEEILHGVDPNEVFPSRTRADTSESDSGICDETPPSQGPATMYQVVYDVSDTDSSQHNVISIELDAWSQLLLSDSCVVNELVPRPEGSLTSTSSADLMDQWSPELQLTEEEQKLLNQEGVTLPGNMPLTKAEERILKRVRRKIRNKQSAQDSRRRRKEYIDTLENRAAACSAQNKELQRTVEQLEKNNMSLLAQLRQLQTLIKRTVSKGAQTSTCLLIIIVSLGLIILPSFSPFPRRSTSGDDYRPIGVISRNILTDHASLQPPANDDAALSLQSDTESADVSQSEAEDAPAAGVNQSEPIPEPRRYRRTNQNRSPLLLPGRTHRSDWRVKDATRPNPLTQTRCREWGALYSL